jgi:hypothetical protein
VQAFDMTGYMEFLSQFEEKGIKASG